MSFIPSPANLSLNYHGLTTQQAAVNLKQYGGNERPRLKKKTSFGRLLHIISEPMVLLLFATAIVYFFLGNSIETIFLLGTVIPIAFIEFLQETKTDQAIEALDKMLVEECHVYRDGRLVKLPSAQIVPGDLVYLTAGDKIPADGVVVHSPGLMIDEAVLTGESVPVVKGEIHQDKKIVGEDNKVFQGTMAVQGEANILITATGGETAYGKIGNLLEKIGQQKTPLQIKLEKLVKILAGVAVLAILIVGSVLTYNHGWREGLLGALTVAMSIIPEEFPIVFSAFLIMGVWRMTKQNALVREMALVETLGSVTTVCSDKTGTLTEGKMLLEKVYFEDKFHSTQIGGHANEKIKDLIADAMLALERNAVDPMEIEIQRFGATLGLKTNEFYKNFNLKKDSTFSSTSKMAHHMWQSKDGCFQYTAGAPEVVIASCDMDAAQRVAALNAYEEMAASGYRLITVAKKACQPNGDFSLTGLEYRGLLVMSDPPRAGVSEAVQLCKKAGVRVVMITGDNILTAKAVAKKIGLSIDGEAIEGKNLDHYSEADLQKLVKTTNIFARIRPEQKYAIVEAFQKNGEIVAMTGDGVNDAPALKKATIGVAMGKKGTEVARAAAGMVLLDDDFSTIVRALKEGRRIYDNIRYAFVFLFSFHIPIVFLSLVPIMFGEELFFLPVHIIFLEMFGDPAAVLGFERDPLRRGAMNEPPRPPAEPLINPRLWKQIVIQGLSISAVTMFFFFYYELHLGNLALGRTMSFVSLIICQVVLILGTREWAQVKANKLLLGISLATLVMLNVVIFIPFLRMLFHFTLLSWGQYGLVFGTSVLAMALVSFVVKKINK